VKREKEEGKNKKTRRRKTEEPTKTKNDKAFLAEDLLNHPSSQDSNFPTVWTRGQETRL